jgi:type IV secretion system protein TrbL
MRAGTAMGSAAGTAYRLGQETSGSPTIGAGMSGVAGAAGHAARDRFSKAAGLGEAAAKGEQAAFLAGAKGPSTEAGGGTSARPDPAPGWARQLRNEQTSRHHRHLALQAIRDGDPGGAGATPDIDPEKDR